MPGNSVNVELWNLRVPLDPPIQAPKGLTTETCLLLIFLSDDKGNRGVGYASFRRSADMDQASAVARKLVAESAPGLAGLLNVERQEEATCAGNSASKSAASAVSLAAWDLAGKTGGRALRRSVGAPGGTR